MKRPSYVYFLGFVVVVGLIGGVLGIGAGAIRIIGLIVCFPLVYGASWFLLKDWRESHVPKAQRKAREEWFKSGPPVDQSRSWK